MDDAITELLKLLDSERDALVEGRFDDLERMGADKEHLMRRVAELSVPQDQMEQLRRRSEANSRLLGAAAAGFRAALDRIRSSREPAPTLKTYTADGSRFPLGKLRPRHERRA